MFVKNKYLIYVPFVLIVLIQFFDKNDKYLYLQYVLLTIIVFAVILKLVLRGRKSK